MLREEQSISRTKQLNQWIIQSTNRLFTESSLNQKYLNGQLKDDVQVKSSKKIG